LPRNVLLFLCHYSSLLRGTLSQESDLISLLLFFEIKKIG
jgi:hypothetical protein